MGMLPAVRGSVARWQDPGESGWRIFGRLKDGGSVGQVNAELRTMAARSPDLFPNGPLIGSTGGERWSGPVSAEKRIEFLLVVVLPLVVASLRFLAAGHRVAYAVLVGLGAGLMLWIPAWAPVSWPTAVVARLPLLLDSGIVIDLDPRPEKEFVDLGFGPLDAALTRWLPAVWPTLLAIYAILAAIWTAGLLFARWPGRAQT